MSKRKDMQHIFNADVDKSSSWHSVAKGDEPLSYIDCLFSYGDGQIAKGFMLDNRCVYLEEKSLICLLYTSPSPRDISGSRMPSSA